MTGLEKIKNAMLELNNTNSLLQKEKILIKYDCAELRSFLNINLNICTFADLMVEI